MSIIKLYAEECDPGVTLISNVFIDYMLKDANDAQLKVYLYLIRHITNHKPFDISNTTAMPPTSSKPPDGSRNT